MNISVDLIMVGVKQVQDFSSCDRYGGKDDCNQTSEDVIQEGIADKTIEDVIQKGLASRHWKK